MIYQNCWVNIRHFTWYVCFKYQHLDGFTIIFTLAFKSLINYTMFYSYIYVFLINKVSIKSLEDVVRKYLALAEEKTETARKESHQAVVDVDDLDVIQTPEK